LLILDIEEGAIPEPLNLTVSLRGTREVRKDCQIFRLTGLLDAFSEPAVRKVIGNYIEQGPPQIVLVLSQIDFIDSSGLGALVQLVKQATNKGGTLQIVTNPRVTQTVKLVRLEKFLSLQPTLEAALASLKQSKKGKGE
jgi:anti-anti-sigma factor